MVITDINQAGNGAFQSIKENESTWHKWVKFAPRVTHYVNGFIYEGNNLSSAGLLSH